MPCAAAAAALGSLEALRGVHPVFIEGPGRADTRDARAVGLNIARQLRLHWEQRPPPSGPKILVVQGDPLTEHGISAVTRVVSGYQSQSVGLQKLSVLFVWRCQRMK